MTKRSHCPTGGERGLERRLSHWPQRNGKEEHVAHTSGLQQQDQSRRRIGRQGQGRSTVRLKIVKNEEKKGGGE